MRATLHPFRLPLRAPLQLASGLLEARTGVLLALTEDGVTGWGEASPLPGFSRESLAEACAALSAWTPGSPTDALPASARAAADGALWEWNAARAGVALPAFLASKRRSSVALSALLAGPLDVVTARAREVCAGGYRAAKLKVGGRPLADDVARVRAVSGALGPDVALRLDANRAWSYSDAVAFAEALPDVPIALLEEPLQDTRRLPDLAAATRLPIGLDESLLDLQPSDLAAHAYAHTVVLKPTLLGGVHACMEWGRSAHALGMDVVVSGAFESGIGTRQALALAAVLGPAPAGLDPYTFLAADVLIPPLDLGSATADVYEALAPRQVRV